MPVDDEFLQVGMHSKTEAKIFHSLKHIESTSDNIVIDNV